VIDAVNAGRRARPGTGNPSRATSRSGPVPPSTAPSASSPSTARPDWPSRRAGSPTRRLSARTRTSARARL